MFEPLDEPDRETKRQRMDRHDRKPVTMKESMHVERMMRSHPRTTMCLKEMHMDQAQSFLRGMWTALMILDELLLIDRHEVRKKLGG